MKKFSIIVLSFVFIFSFLGLSVAHAATAPDLGSTSSFGIVSSTSTNTNTSPQTKIYGSVCGTTLDIPRPLVITGGAEETPCNPLKQTDQGTALATLNNQTCTAIAGTTLDAVTIGSNQPGVFPPGCYAFDGAINITSGTTVVLDATAPDGDGGNVWVFTSVGGLTTGASTALFPSVRLAHGASANNVFWAPGGATSLGANYALSITPSFVGTIIDDAGISLGQFANLLGRALDFATTVTTDSNTITVPTTLTLIKDVAGSAVANTSWTLSTVSPSPTIISGVTGNINVTNAVVVPGEYTLAESGPSNYTATYSCVINDGAPTQILALPGNPITLTDGDDAICTITNEANAPQLTLVKEVGRGGLLTSEDFMLHAYRAGLTHVDGYSGTAAVTDQSVAVGTYDLSETTEIPQPDYTAEPWTCNGGIVGDDTVTLANGDDVTCTLENNYTAPVVHHSSSGSIPRVVAPVFSPSITILSTPVVIVPKLPKTGFAPQESGIWYESLLNNILNLFR